MTTTQAAKHTPGPWEVGTGSMPKDGKDCAVIADCMVIARMEYFDPVNGRANARLIAQAPAMAEKLDKVATWLERLAESAEQAAINHREFQSLAEAERADAKNYRATAKDVRRVLRDAGVES